MGGPTKYEKRMIALSKQADELDDYLSDDNECEAPVDRSDEDRFIHDYSHCVVVDNLPKVPEAKFEKLNNVIKKLFSQMGSIEHFDMPHEGGVSLGCAFVEFDSEASAAKAVSSVNNFALDKKHTLRVNHYADIEKFIATSETYEPLVKPEFKPQPDLKQWLADQRGRDMFVLRHKGETEIFWSDQGKTLLHYDGEKEKEGGKQWCSQYVTWSPQGTYLATFHPQGIALWGGLEFEKLGRFAHKNVKIVLFSPKENYLITCSSDLESNSGIIVWDVKSGKMLRAFPASGGANGIPGVVTPFRWSHDDAYVARRGKDVISVYETPSMKLLGKKSLKADGVHNFFWSPTDNILSYWSPESANAPARVCLVDMPSRKELRRKNLFNVSDCKLHWHAGGHYLCVKVTRHSKSKKTLYTNFELFRLREELVPVEMMELKDPVVAFAWEPKGTRLALAFGESSQRLNVSFYDMCGGVRKNELTLVYTLTDKPCNHLYWSPQGNYVVLAGLGEMNGTLEFWNTDERQSLAVQEHFKCTSVEWDPSGRIVSSSMCQAIENAYYKFTMDNGYNLWSFQGKNLLEVKKDAFYQFLWRPRPKSLLTDDEYHEVVKNLKKYEKKFHDADRKKEKDRQAVEKSKKLALRMAFVELMETRRAAYAASRPQLIALRDGYDTDDDALYDIKTTAYDQVLSETKDIMSTKRRS